VGFRKEFEDMVSPFNLRIGLPLGCACIEQAGEALYLI
jgi:hypothetical protein